ncbi:hypothetical protein FJ251_10715 [bacterium]|nr:hypothetical protein [bacterium]
MKRILMLMALALLVALAGSGCGKKAEATVPCVGGCGMELTKADAKVIDGKSYCAGCAAQLSAPPAGEELSTAPAADDRVKCAGGCGMEMAKADAVQVQGKHYCQGCAEHAGHGH